MQISQVGHHSGDVDDNNFDDLVASLFVLITHHSLTKCESALPQILDRIHELTQHADIECYPEQLRVLLKMQALWRTHLFRAEINGIRH